jgi:DNA helicase-2/ATP-dependent DNA helicase PcrA
LLRFFGPPGTGKTTTLLNLVDDALVKGITANDIGYFAYTRKASHEARDRAVVRFNLDADKDFTYFRTLHSLAFRLLGLSSSDVLSEKHLKDFSNTIGIDLSQGTKNDDDEGFTIYRSDHPMMRVADLARTTELGPEVAYNQSQLHEPRHLFLHVSKEYEAFKKKNNLIDFTDMLVKLSERPEIFPNFKLCFVDEAQDLTPLQWRVVNILNKQSERMYIAGDDDQGIYAWAGADLDRFVNLEGGSEVLSQSYRVPRSIWEIAQKVCTRIKKRQPKTWFPREDDGLVHRVYDTYGLNFNPQEEWLILAQANYMLSETAGDLKRQGVFFERYGEASLGKRVRNAIFSWNHITSKNNKEISVAEAQNLFNHISTGDGKLKRGGKALLKVAHEEDTFTYGVLREHFGLEIEETKNWQAALDKIKPEDRAYAELLLSRGVDISKKPKIKLSTIHGAKGGEADNVLLHLDLTGKALEEMARNPDNANRVLYVGITRAKKQLILKMPKDLQRGWTI